MGTRSRVGVMHGTVCKSVYCHYDGYLEYTGKLLLENYDSATANELVARGDNSGVQKTLGDMNFYSDRGETNVSWQVAHTFEEFLEQVHNCGGEYYYIMRDGVWYCGDRGQLTLLSEALVDELIEEEIKTWETVDL